MKTRAFSKSYGARTVLTMPELKLEPGKVCAVVGANGSGKSTLARVLAGVLRPDGGRPVLPPELSVGYMPQKSYAFRMSTLANARLSGASEAEARAMLESLGIGHLARHQAVRLSGGETARMALARVLLRPCALLILDEPTASMDMESTVLSETLLAETCRKNGSAVLLVTHSLPQARRLADSALFLHKGTLLESGPADRVLRTPSCPETARFLEFYGRG